MKYNNTTLRQVLHHYCDKIVFFFAVLLCCSVVFFHLLYSFEDVGIYLQKVHDKAHYSSLKPILNQKQLLQLQASMFNKDSKVIMSDSQIELGKILFFDPRLSGDGTKSCNTCHNVALQGTSLVDKSVNNPNHLNVPTIFNTVFNETLYFKGMIDKHHRADKNITEFLGKNTVARASLHALSASNEMQGDIKKIIAGITKSPEYMSYFIRTYGAKVKVTEYLIAQSLAAFIMTLNTPSRYDDFLSGNLKALSISEAEGLEIFIDKGCVACHNGINLGGSMQPFGVIQQYRFENIGNFGTDSYGMLKVPTLRNITHSAPYFHNGGIEKLEDAIKEMARVQIGINLSNKEVAKIMEFFESLRGSSPTVVIPSLPRATF